MKLCKNCLQPKDVHTEGWRCQNYEPGPTAPGTQKRRRGKAAPAEDGKSVPYMLSAMRTMMAQTLRYVADCLELDASAIAMATRRGLSPSIQIAAALESAGTALTTAGAAAPAPKASQAPKTQTNGAGHGPDLKARPRRETTDGLSGCEYKILEVLKARGRPTSAVVVGLLSGYRLTGTFLGAITTLRQAEYLSGPNAAMQITTEGKDKIGPATPLPTGPQALSYWKKELGECPGKMLEALLLEHPGEIEVVKLAERTKYKVTGTFLGWVTTLTKLKLAERPRKKFIKASREAAEVLGAS